MSYDVRACLAFWFKKHFTSKTIILWSGKFELPKLVNISAKRVARLGQKRYRTARNHRNTFRPTILLNLRFRRKKGFFAEKCSFFTKFAFCQVFKIVLFLEKNREFLKKKFIKYYYFIRILQRICHLFQILKKKSWFFPTNNKPFFPKKTKFVRTFEKS